MSRNRNLSGGQFPDPVFASVGHHQGRQYRSAVVDPHREDRDRVEFTEWGDLPEKNLGNLPDPGTVEAVRYRGGVGDSPREELARGSFSDRESAAAWARKVLESP